MMSFFDGRNPFNSGRKNFIIIGHRALSDGSINLKDLCGASGRWDGIARFITAGLFLSHDMRRDTVVHAVLLGPKDPPKILTVDGRSVKYLNPDERSTAALMRKNLSPPLGDGSGATRKTSPGIHVTRGDLRTLLGEMKGDLILLHEEGDDAHERLPNKVREGGPLIFILSDDMEFDESDLEAIHEFDHEKLSVGPLSLHSHQSVTVVHSIMDRVKAHS